MNLKVSEVENLSLGELVSKGEDIFITSCVIDSRKAVNGSLFIPFKGERVNGYNYMENAVENGASCIFIEDIKYYKESLKCHFILVEDNTKALQNLAQNYRDKLDLKVIGITGSNGKTTTKDLIATIVAQKGKTLKTQGNLNNHLGLPLSILSCDDSYHFAVLEMGMSNLGEIDLLSKISSPNLGVITNIGESHIENLKSKENIAKAKGEIFNHIKHDGLAVLNGDDPYLIEMAENLSNVLLYGLNKSNHIYAENIRGYEHGMVFDVKGLGINTAIKLPMFGEHNIYNSLSAIGVGLKLGLSEEQIQQGLFNLEMTGMRTEVTKLKNNIVMINDCYNASETSTKAALKVLKDLEEGRTKVAILGDMLELGDYTKTAHYNVGDYATQLGVDTIVAVGQFSEYIKEGAIKNGFKGEFLTFSDSISTKNNISEIVKPNSIVLIKGSRGIKMEIIADQIREEF